MPHGNAIADPMVENSPGRRRRHKPQHDSLGNFIQMHVAGNNFIVGVDHADRGLSNSAG